MNDCLDNSDTTVTKYSCYCTKDNHPAKYRCPSLPEDLQGIPVEQCQLLVDNDPREGDAFTITRLCQIDNDLSTHCLYSEDLHQDNCICTPIYHPSTFECDTSSNPSFDIEKHVKKNNDDDSYTKTECEDEKYSAIDYCDESDSPSIYPKLPICIDGNSLVGCVCPKDSNDLIGVPITQCEFRTIEYPRSGLTTNSDLTDHTECEADKAYTLLIDCNGVHGSSVKTNTCKCIDGQTPTGCTCLRDTDLNQLGGVLLGQCEYIDEDDPRVWISCPICRNVVVKIFNQLHLGVSYELDFALSCLRSVKLKSNEQSITINLLKEYLNSYAFLDTSFNLIGSPIGNGKHAVNKNNSLHSISANTSYTNTFDFYEQIMILFINLKDPHTIFTPPCVSKVYNMFPQITVNQRTYPTLEAIARWADEEVSISRNPITRMNYALMDFNSQTGGQKVNKLLIDLSADGGGQVQLGKQLLNFLFLKVGHPLYKIVDEIKSDINITLANITLYQSEHNKDETQLTLELDYMGIDKLFYSRGNRKRTSQSEDKNTCSQFVKHIGEKHLGRIVGVGAPYPVEKDIRFDVGMATSGSVYNYQSVQDIKSNSFPPLTQEDKQKLPNKFYRIGTDLSWSNKGGYGFTDETNNQLFEYKIVDTDFRIQYFPFDSLISDEDEQRYAFVRGSPEAKGRYSNGTAKIGEYLTDKCIFSHCKKCSLVLLGPNQDRSEIIPDQTEDAETDSNQCYLHVILDEQQEQEEGEDEEQQYSDQDKQKEIETSEPKSKAEMISGIVVAGVIVVASIVAMIIVAVAIQHQKYSGLGRRGQQLISVDA
ncbi:MAG: hypothetical protein EZS28_009482 [Streblomastix strix]|uniref:Uncharacterized protein n=1 Tax=Streblomastix strix TaxID=222440 RepID=A0A5J4WJP7_9EUKA|nr:MAG: hypothetical protein EZS28_009482 [Streblomastix strix]